MKRATASRQNLPGGAARVIGAEQQALGAKGVARAADRVG